MNIQKRFIENHSRAGTTEQTGVNGSPLGWDSYQNMCTMRPVGRHMCTGVFTLYLTG